MAKTCKTLVKGQWAEPKRLEWYAPTIAVNANPVRVTS